MGLERRSVVSKKWDPKEGSPAYELTVKSITIALDRANWYMITHPSTYGLFAGQKGKKKNGRKKV
jgi:hypothetical protein